MKRADRVLGRPRFQCEVRKNVQRSGVRHPRAVSRPRRQFAQKPSRYLRRFDLDTVSHSGPVLDFPIQISDIDRPVPGSDYCSDMGYEQPAAFLDRLDLPPDKKNLIPAGNAAQLPKI